MRCALQTAREQGYTLNNREAFVGDSSVAVPLLDRLRHACSAFESLSRSCMAYRRNSRSD
jgi:DNA-binding IclR family transcriptional regulator